MKYKKVVSFVVEGDHKEFAENIVGKHESATLYDIGEIKAFETVKEAAETLIRECTDGDYDDWVFSDAAEVLKQIFFTMKADDAESAVELAYDNAKAPYSREHVFSVIRSEYYHYEYSNVLKRILHKALVDSDVDIMMDAADAAMEYFPDEFRSTIENMSETDNIWVNRFLKKVLAD